MIIKNYIDRGEALNTIRSFISELRPESTGLICEIYSAILKMDHVTLIERTKEESDV